MQRVNVNAIRRDAEDNLVSPAIALEMCDEIEELAEDYNEALSVIDETKESLDSILNLPMHTSAGEVMRFVTRIKVRLMAAQLILKPYNLGENRE